MQKLSQSKKEQMCKDWNDVNPIGTKVILTDDFKNEHQTLTISTAFMLGGHTPVVHTEYRGCYLLSRIKAV